MPFLNNIGSKIYGIILIVGSAVALCVIAIMAIKFMTSGAEEKAQVKEKPDRIYNRRSNYSIMCSRTIKCFTKELDCKIGA